MLASGIAQSKHNDTCPTPFCQSRDLAEIEVKGQNHSIFSNTFVKDLSVGQSLQPFVRQMRYVVPMISEPLNHPATIVNVLSRVT
jgi:hypothetical protein